MRFLYGLGGVLLVGCLSYLAGTLSAPVVAGSTLKKAVQPPNFEHLLQTSPVQLPAGRQEPGIDELLDQVGAVRAKKVELEKQEAALVSQFKERMEQLKRKADGLGIRLSDKPVAPSVTLP